MIDAAHNAGMDTDIADETMAIIDQAMKVAIVRRTLTAKDRKPSKTDILIDMLQGTGATIDELVEATGWQPHSTRAAISHILKKKLGLTVISEKIDGRGRVYRVAQ